MISKNTILPKCIQLLGITLLGSSLLKGLSPAQAVAWLSSTGMGISESLLLVPLVGLVEALVGASLLLYSHFRWARIGALLFFLGIVCVRIYALLEDASSDCGCFGALAIPAPLLWTFLATGLLITVISLLQGSPPGPARWAGIRFMIAVLLVGLASLPAVLEIPNAQKSSTWQERIAATSHQRFLIVGATDCPHCRALLARLPQDRLEEIAFLIRQDDQGELPNPSPRLHRIPASIWWNALEQAPPALFERDKGPLLHRLEESQFLERLVR